MQDIFNRKGKNGKRKANKEKCPLYTYIIERLYFVPAYWVTSDRVEATGGKLFSPEGIFFYSMLVTPSERW